MLRLIMARLLQVSTKWKQNDEQWMYLANFSLSSVHIHHYHVTNKFLALSSRRESPSLQQRVPFCSLLPFRRKLLCYPSKWVSEWVCVTIESEPWKNSADFDPILPYRWNFLGDGVFLEYFTEMLLSFIFGPNVVNYDILRNNWRSKLHAVIVLLITRGDIRSRRYEVKKIDSIWILGELRTYKWNEGVIIAVVITI